MNQNYSVKIKADTCNLKKSSVINVYTLQIFLVIGIYLLGFSSTLGGSQEEYF